MTPEQQRALALQVIQRRAEARLTQTALAGLANLAVNTISALETLERVPEPITVVQVCKVLQIDPEPYLLPPKKS